MVMSVASLAVAWNLISPAEAQPRVIGRTLSTADGPAFDMPGVTIYGQVTGTSTISALMSKKHVDDSSEDSFVVECDGQRVAGSGLAGASFSTAGWASDAQVTVPLCSGLDPSKEHTVAVVKSTEAQWNSLRPTPNYVTFMGFLGDSSMQELTPKPRTRRLEFLGDSITAGYCNLCNDELHPQGVSSEGFYDAWAHVICETLEADCHVTAWSGYGMVMNCCGGETLASDVWQRTLASVPSDTGDVHGTTDENVWDFKSWRPDGVVINLGTNDNLAGRPQLVEDYNATYLQLVLDADQAYGHGTTDFFLACGPMAESYCSEISWVMTQAAAKGVKVNFLDQRGFDSGAYGPKCCGHPGKKIDEAMGASGSQSIAKQLGWEVQAVV